MSKQELKTPALRDMCIFVSVHHLWHGKEKSGQGFKHTNAFSWMF